MKKSIVLPIIIGSLLMGTSVVASGNVFRSNEFCYAESDFDILENALAEGVALAGQSGYTDGYDKGYTEGYDSVRLTIENPIEIECIRLGVQNPQSEDASCEMRFDTIGKKKLVIGRMCTTYKGNKPSGTYGGEVYGYLMDGTEVLIHSTTTMETNIVLDVSQYTELRLRVWQRGTSPDYEIGLISLCNS